MENKKLRKFNHIRKGIIEGYVIKEDDEWMTIEIPSYQIIKYSGGNQGLEPGETITIRKSLVEEIIDEERNTNE